MKNKIKIDISNRDDFFDKYNNEKVSKELIEYIIEEAKFLRYEEDLNIVIKIDEDEDLDDCKDKIKEGLKLEYEKSNRKEKYDNFKQVVLLIIGILFLFLSTVPNEGFVFKEVFLIIGWVPIWEVIDIELFSDLKLRRKRKIIKKLLKSDIITTKK